VADPPEHHNRVTAATGVIGVVERGLLACLWLVRRPFVAPRWAWSIATAASVGVTIAAALTGMLVVSIAASAVALLGAAVRLQWWRLGHGDDPVVLISLHSGGTASAREASGTQLRSLRRFLSTNTYVSDAGGVVVRTVGVPISRGDARRLLQLAQVILVVRGETEAGGDLGYFHSEAHFRDDAPSISLNRFDLSVYTDGPRPGRLRRALGTGAVTYVGHEEGDLEMRRFASASISIAHFDQLAKVLLVLLAEKALEAPHRLRSPGTLILPDRNDPDLEDGLQARALVLEAETRRQENPRQLLEEFERRALDDNIGGERLAAWLVAQWFGGEVEKWTTRDETADAAARWSERYPTSSLLALNLAASQLRTDDVKSAKRTLAHARSLGAQPAEYERLLGNVAWREKEPARALEHYKLVTTTRRDALAWQIGDCYAALGDRKRALRAYRRSLRRDPFRVPAAEHARVVFGWPTLLPTYPGGWRLSVWSLMHRWPRSVGPLMGLWRRTRPEDPYLATWVGRQALLRGNMRRADQWTFYATRFAETNRLIPQLDQLVVLALMGDPQAQGWAEFTAKHLDWLIEHGLAEAQLDAALATHALFSKIKYLDDQPEAQTVTDLVMCAAQLQEPPGAA